MNQPPKDVATLHIRPYFNEEHGKYSIELYVHGLASDRMAYALAERFVELLGGTEIDEN